MHYWNKFRKKPFFIFGTLTLIKPCLFAARDVEGSRVILLTDILNSSIDVERLFSSLEDRSSEDVDLVVLQRNDPHSSFSALSRGKDR